MSLPPEIRHIVLFDRSINAEDMGSILVADEHGNVVLDSKSARPRSISVADRDFFVAQKKSSDLGVYVSQPFVPRAQGAGVSVGLSIRLATSDGGFGGVLVGTLRLNYFRRQFEGVGLGESGTLTLVREDGVVIMRRPFDERAIGRKLPASAYSKWSGRSYGSRMGEGAFDSVERLYSFRRIGKFPLIIIVGRSMDDILKSWRSRAAAFCALISCVDCTILGLSLSLARQWKERAAFEVHLHEMVGTDSMTGLSSRRALEDLADVEWLRALRDHTPLSMLMIDVDQFKAYNDAYGHLAGDDALRAVARCIGAAVKRPGDIAGRYGGEEFSVVLPSTTTAGAKVVANAIRDAVRRQDIKHESSLSGRLTVSIGIASMTKRNDFSSLREVVQAADAALYKAKAMGRDRIVVGESFLHDGVLEN
ncbi:diguanylate cyclase [Paraburkholderia strydomiana]